MSFLNVSDSQKQQLTMSALVVAGVALTLALFWNNAINSLIDTYIPEIENNKNAWFKVAVAVIATLIVGVVLQFM